MNDKLTISIDPGLKGAAIAWRNTEMVGAMQWTTEGAAEDWFRIFVQPSTVVLIEDVTRSMTNEVHSAAKLAQNYGFWRGLARGHHVEPIAVPAVKWSRAFKKPGESLNYSQRKSRWRTKANQLYPQHPYTNSDTADAILIGHWFIHYQTAELPLT